MSKVSLTFLLEVVSVLSVLIIFSIDTLGCNCVVPAICQAYGRADAVFTGRLAKIEKDEKSTIETVYASFNVEKTLKGRTKRVEVVKFIIGSCGRTLNIGETYFVYKEQASASNPVCNITRPLSKAVLDLRYASSLSESEPIFTVDGLVTGLTEDELAGTKVVVEFGEHRKIVSIEKGGFYEAVLKDKGIYNVRILLPIERAVFINNLGVMEKVVGKEISYRVDFSPNKCDFREISIGEATTTSSLRTQAYSSIQAAKGRMWTGLRFSRRKTSRSARGQDARLEPTASSVPTTTATGILPIV